MNPLEYGVSKIRQSIPELIINQAFAPTGWQYALERISIDGAIRRSVMEAIVLTDCNIVGGQVVEIPLRNATFDYLSNGIRIAVPTDRTMGRNISSVLSLELSPHNAVPGPIDQGIPSSSGTSEVYLVAPNTIFTPMATMSPLQAFLRCTLDNDPNFANISQKSLYVFGELCVLAAKFYVYNKLAINMTLGHLGGNQVDGQMRSIIDGYADAQELYSELLTKRWRKITIMQDTKQHNRLIEAGIGWSS